MQFKTNSPKNLVYGKPRWFPIPFHLICARLLFNAHIYLSCSSALFINLVFSLNKVSVFIISLFI